MPSCVARSSMVAPVAWANGSQSVSSSMVTSVDFATGSRCRESSLSKRPSLR